MSLIPRYGYWNRILLSSELQRGDSVVDFRGCSVLGTISCISGRIERTSKSRRTWNSIYSMRCVRCMIDRPPKREGRSVLIPSKVCIPRVPTVWRIGRWKTGSFIHRRIRNSGLLPKSFVFFFRVGRPRNPSRAFFRELQSIFREGDTPFAR